MWAGSKITEAFNVMCFEQVRNKETWQSTGEEAVVLLMLFGFMFRKPTRNVLFGLERLLPCQGQ